MGCLLKRNRICFVTTLPITLKTFLSAQSEYLISHGWDVTWISSFEETKDNSIPAGVELISIPFKRGVDFIGTLWLIFRLYKIFKNRKFDIVQYSTPNASFCASFAAFLSQCPVRLYAQWGIRYVGFDGFARKIFWLLEKCSCFCSTIIEPDSYSNLEFSISEKLYCADKCRVVWNGSASGVDLSLFDIGNRDVWRKEYRRKLGIEDDQIVIGFVGSVRRDKGCNELINACRSFFNELPNCRLLIVGDKTFYSSIDVDLRNWCANSTQVIYVPPNKEIPKYMSSMDIFTLPSYREGFGSVIVEAEAMGLPVVVTNVPGPIDAMIDNVTGVIVPVKNSEQLACALKLLISDRQKCAEFGRAAVDYARSNFDKDTFLKKVMEDKLNLLSTCKVN